MSKALRALWKIDHTICMNFNEKNIKWNIDNKDDPTLYQNGKGYDPEDTDCKSFEDFCDCYDEIETALKDKEEQDKALKIIAKKNVDIQFLMGCGSVSAYNVQHTKNYLTIWEFCLIKEVMKRCNIC